MTGIPLSKIDKTPSRTWMVCLLLAFLVETLGIGLTGVKISLARKKETTEAPTEVDVVTIPEEAPHLKSETVKAPAKSDEETVSEKPKAGDPSKSLSAAPTTNQVEKGKPLSATHGPVLIESPAPVIPDYLKNRDLSTKVLIEFNVLPSGQAEPRLLVSSGDEELDQIALSTAKKWKFYPAENNHEAVAAKIRLRILFSVH